MPPGVEVLGPPEVDDGEVCSVVGPLLGGAVLGPPEVVGGTLSTVVDIPGDDVLDITGEVGLPVVVVLKQSVKQKNGRNVQFLKLHIEIRMS